MEISFKNAHRCVSIIYTYLCRNPVVPQGLNKCFKENGASEAELSSFPRQYMAICVFISVQRYLYLAHQKHSKSKLFLI